MSKTNDIKTVNKDLFLKEIDVIQDIIKRMAESSLSIKKWCITIIVATIVFKASSPEIWFIPLVLFWYLDWYYLRQEKLFRELYKLKIKKRENNNFDLLFDLSTEEVEWKVEWLFKTIISWILVKFYVLILLFLILTVLY